MMFSKPRLLRPQNDTRRPFYRARWCADRATRWVYGTVRDTDLEARRDLLELIRPDEDGHGEVLVVEALDPDEARRAFVRSADCGGKARVLFRSNWRTEHAMFPGEWREIVWIQLQREGKGGVEDYAGAGPIDPKRLRTWGDVLERFGGGKYRAFAFGDTPDHGGLLMVAPPRGLWKELVGEPKPFGPCPSIEWPVISPASGSGSKPPGGGA
jgi:hypothetical protein